jgi:hypothetical protein
MLQSLLIFGVLITFGLKFSVWVYISGLEKRIGSQAASFIS